MLVSKQDIITAIKNLDFFLRVPELQGAKPKINSNGSPFVFVGGFNMVFQLEHQNKKWAFRVWHVPMGEHKERYRKISKYLSDKNLPYFADFIYDEKGILVNGNLLDTIRMEWLEGKLLKGYIEENVTNKDKLNKLANDFLEMCKTLRENKISHGDLQEGNILIDKNGKIKLVDYDSLCIPEIEGQKELVTGLKGYQHPSRFKSKGTSLKADYFSELIIYLSILALSENSNLWNKYQVKDTQYLLFTENDCEDFENSDIYKDLHKLSGSVKSLTIVLSNYLKEVNYLNLIAIENYLTEIEDDIGTLIPEIVEPESGPNCLSKLAIKRMLIAGLSILFAYILGIWVFNNYYNKQGILNPPPIKDIEIPIVLNCQSRFDSLLYEGEEGMKSRKYVFALSCFVSLSSTLQNCPDNKLAKVSINKLIDLKNDYDKQAKIAREVFKIDNNDDLESRYKLYEKASLQLSVVLKAARND